MATETKLPAPLPVGILAADLKYPSYDSKDPQVEDWQRNSFELWLVNSGKNDMEWFIPTLRIANGRNGNPARSYAIRVSDSSAGWRIGRGPHVKATLTVYVRKSRAQALEKFLAMADAGAEKANQIRDRISSRRAQGAMERAAGHRSWTWNR